jgi:hypothetical protein
VSRRPDDGYDAEPVADMTEARIGATIRAVSLPVLTGLFVRALPVTRADFPLNDGGLFYAMTRDLRDAGFLLPATTTYNGLDIPFAYPPLAFYLAAILSSIPGIELIDLFRLLPVVFATLTIPVVYLLAREILASRFQALLATWAFALLPRAFDWSILGGGVTRSLGWFLASIAILEGIRFYRTRETRHGLGMAVFAALATLSHPGAAVFTITSLILVFLAYGRSRQSFIESVGLGVLAAIIAAPWWVTVIKVHGLEPFLAGGQTSTNLLTSFQFLVTFTITDEPYTTFLAIVGLIGLIYTVAKRRYLLAAWVIVVFVIDPRSATAVMIPLAMLIAVAVDEVLLAPVSGARVDAAERFFPRALRRDRYVWLLLGVGLMLGMFGAVRADTMLFSPLHALAQPNRETMAWIHDNVPAEAEFLVVSGGQWYVDANAEWFPVLTGHSSLNTVQGYEWLGKDAWVQQAVRNEALQKCVFATVECVSDWIETWGLEDAWLYVPVATIDSLSPTGDCCAGLRASIEGSSSFDLVHEGAGGTIFQPRPAP